LLGGQTPPPRLVNVLRVAPPPGSKVPMTQLLTAAGGRTKPPLSPPPFWGVHLVLVDTDFHCGLCTLVGSDGTRIGQNRQCDPVLPCDCPFFCAGAVPLITSKTFVHAKFEANPSTWAASRTVDVSRFRVGRRAATAGGGRAVAARPPPPRGPAAASVPKPQAPTLVRRPKLLYHRFL